MANNETQSTGERLLAPGKWIQIFHVHETPSIKVEIDEINELGIAYWRNKTFEFIPWASVGLIKAIAGGE